MRAGSLTELMSFAAVAEELSFRRAATRMNVSPSALSHTIRRLEERLEVRLINRTTRSVALTEPGSALLAQLTPALAALEEVEQAATSFREGVMGTVRLNVPSMAAHLLFGEGLADFAREYPSVRLEIVVDDDLRDIVGAGFDAGIRLGHQVHRDMIAVRMTGKLRVTVAGSPAYLAARGVPQTPDDLHGHDCINYRWAQTGAAYRWPFVKGGQTREIAVEGPLATNDTHLMIAAALGGTGLVCLLEARLDKELESGALVRVLGDWCTSLPEFYLYYPSRRQLSPALRALIGHLQKRMT